MELRHKLFKKWNIIRITTTYELLKICLFINKLYGVFPYTMSNKKIIVSKVGWYYTVFITTCSVVYLLVALYQCNVSRDIRFKTVEGLLQFNSYYALATFTLVAAVISSKRKIALTQKILIVSEILSEKEFHQLARIFYIKDGIGLIFLNIQAFNFRPPTTYELLSMIYGLYITKIVFLVDAQHSNYILILRSCFKKINSNLLKLKATDKNNSDIFCKTLTHQLKSDTLQFKKLRKLQQKYHEISSVVKDLNSVYIFQSTGSILMTFAEITFGLYFFLLHSQGREGLDIEKQMWFYYYQTSVTYYFLKISTFVWMCECAKNESLKTGIIVHNVILNSKSDKLKKELIMFSLQLLQCNNEFSTKCLTVDAKLLNAMIEGINTYFLILIQFLKIQMSMSKTNEAH